MSLFKHFSLITIIVIIMFSSCTSKKKAPPVTWLYGYGEIYKLNSNVKTLIYKQWSYSKTIPYFTYAFNNKGEMIKIDLFFNDSTYTTRFITISNQKGDKIESTCNYKEKEKTIKEIYKYDDKGLITKYINNGNEPFPDTNRFVYDKNNDLIEHDYCYKKKILWILKYQYVYNNKGACIKDYQSLSSYHDNFKSISKDSTQYIVFDEKNNWLKAIRNGDTLTREITYY